MKSIRMKSFNLFESLGGIESLKFLINYLKRSLFVVRFEKLNEHCLDTTVAITFFCHEINFDIDVVYYTFLTFSNNETVINI